MILPYGSIWRETMGKCFVCENETFENTGTCFSQCTKCKLYINWDYLPKEELRNHLKDFVLSSQHNQESYNGRAAEAQEQLDVIESVLPNKGKLFDVACGHGAFIVEALKRGWEAYGNELSVAASYWSDHYNLPIQTTFFDELDFDDESYDAVVMWNSLEHLHNPKEDLIKSYNMLKKGGVIFIRVPERNAENLNKYLEPFHRVEFNKINLRKILEDTGFTVLTHESVDDGFEAQDILCQK